MAEGASVGLALYGEDGSLEADSTDVQARDGKLVGIVSIGDVVKRLLEKYEQEAELIKQFINS